MRRFIRGCLEGLAAASSARLAVGLVLSAAGVPDGGCVPYLALALSSLALLLAEEAHERVHELRDEVDEVHRNLRDSDDGRGEL